MNVAMHDENPSTPLGLTISQAAHELGVSLGTIRRWSDLGYIDSYRTPGGQRRFSREQIDRFVSSLRTAEARRRRLAV
jgi:excisionase family DNA binding protein